jgi:hypothetical protein
MLPIWLMTWAISLAAMAGCGPAPQPVDEVARREATRVQKVVSLAYPYRILRWEVYADGGSLGVVVRDRWGRRFMFHLAVPSPNRVPSPKELERSPGDTAWMPPRYFWSGGRWNDWRKGRRLTIGGPEESAILDMMDVISLDYFPRATRDSLVGLSRAERERLRQGLSWEQQTALSAGSFPALRGRDPRGSVIWVRGKGYLD